MVILSMVKNNKKSPRRQIEENHGQDPPTRIQKKKRGIVDSAGPRSGWDLQCPPVMASQKSPKSIGQGL